MQTQEKSGYYYILRGLAHGLHPRLLLEDICLQLTASWAIIQGCNPIEVMKVYNKKIRKYHEKHLHTLYEEFGLTIPEEGTSSAQPNSEMTPDNYYQLSTQSNLPLIDGTSFCRSD